MRLATVFVAASLLSVLRLGPAMAADAPVDRPAAPAPAASDAAPAAPAAPTLHRRTYELQHRLIPNWVHKSEGAFYTALVVGDLARLREVAGELVSPDYAAGIKVTAYPALEGVLIEYPAPLTPPLCYFAFVHATGKSSTGYEIYTYEKTMKIPGLDSGYGVVGGWTPDGKHLNLGGRDYQDAESFVRDLKLDRQASKTAGNPS